jgi:rare lipoprotein A (peptidoglycan hydrolase)
VNTTPHGRLRKPALALSAVAAAAAVPAIAPADADAAAIKFKVDQHVLAGQALKVRGLLGSAPGQEVRVQRTRGSHWHTVETVKTASDGRFKTSLNTDALGKMRIRALGPDGAASHVRSAIAYRSAPASYYGPGLYGQKLACGGTLTPSTIGVANKTLPCGTRVRLHYRGHDVKARVIDRGPYAGNRVYDLTEATKNRLHFGSTGNVWATK